MVRVIFSAQGNVIDYDDYIEPERDYSDCREECTKCGALYDPDYSGNYADMCKSCWKELNIAMRQALTKALNDFTPQEVKLLDEWGSLGDMFLECVDKRISANKRQKKK
jgi:hypothetical protein